jgi:hypothetical protein
MIPPTATDLARLAFMRYSDEAGRVCIAPAIMGLPDVFLCLPPGIDHMELAALVGKSSPVILFG